MPQIPSVAVGVEPQLIVRHPTMLIDAEGVAPAPEDVEETLTEWFGAPTLLFSSGRAACHVFLAESGFNRNRNTIMVPPFLTRCILNALALDAFPVRQSGADAVLYHHPYGLRLRSAPREALVVEDSVHAFFSSPVTGARRWSGAVAIFSLSKFFSTAGIVGALVIPDAELAKRIAARRDRAPNIDTELAAWRRDVIVRANYYGDSWAGTHLLDSAYSLLTEFPKVDPQTLDGIPTDIAGLKAAGTARRERLQLYADLLGGTFPHFIFENGIDDLPFALPYFGSGNREALSKIDADLLRLGVRCRGIYALNAGGSFYEPEYRDCLLIPCHQYIAIEVIEQICDVIRKGDAGVRRVAG